MPDPSSPLARIGGVLAPSQSADPVSPATPAAPLAQSVSPGIPPATPPRTTGLEGLIELMTPASFPSSPPDSPADSLVDSVPPATVSPSVTPIMPIQDPASPSAQPPSDDLALFEQAMAEVEQIAPQAVPTAMLQTVADAQAAQALQTPGRAGNKERAATTAPDAQAAAESGQNVQYVEYEPNPELPPEVEGYLNQVEQHGDQAPNEIVIADSAQPLPATRQLPSQPVVVLPITPEVEKAGVKKSPQFSIRWLVEWSHKIMKVFVGKVIYRSA